MKIPLFKIYWDRSDVASATDSVKRGMFWAAGPNIEKFEKLLSQYLGVKYVLVFNSGTAALHSLLMAHGIGKGDEVIVPSFTFIATCNAPLFVGAKPVFADIEQARYGLDPKDVEKKITKKTKAIIAVHYGGVPCKIQALKKIAKKYHLLLIEDAAESFGAKEYGKQVGTFGDCAMFSFCQTKVFTTGEGGCALTNSKAIFEKLKLIRSHGRLEDGSYFSSGNYMDYVTLGYNFRMADIVAALGVSQIKKVDRLIKKRQENTKYMNRILSRIEGLIIPTFQANIRNVCQEYPVHITEGKKTRDSLKKYLFSRGIGTRISFAPVHLTHFYKKVLGYNTTLAVTEKISSRALTLPMYPSLTKKEMDYIAKEIKLFFRKNGQ